ncbi:YitT family protein [Dethiothermospora halolimnae]|uniref:YitT family protein n=1 Tax=Dethiothermospora halolimnae TaxID=3114390 RepID=UPI003CCBF969
MQLAKKASSSFKKVSLDSSSLAEPLTKLGAIFLGNLLCSIAFNGFFIPNQLISGGTGGIAIMTYYLTEIPTGLVVFLLNLPLFFVGAKIIDKKFTIYSFISMITLSSLLGLTADIHKYIEIDDLLLASIFGGILNGVGMGLMFRNKVSQGGLDIVAAIFRKKFNMNVGTVLMGVNTIIVASSSILFGLKPAMYTIIALYIAYQIVDKVQKGLDTKKTVVIISKNSEKLAKEIIGNLKRGVTFLNGEGAYNNDNKKIIYCTVMSTQVGKLKDIVEKIDSDAFITINDVEEVKGKGFKDIGI